MANAGCGGKRPCAKRLEAAGIKKVSQPMTKSFAHYLIRLLTISTTLSATAGNWPAWRGPEGTGVSIEKNLPVKWSTNENVRWRVGVPDRGEPSPTLLGGPGFVPPAGRK